MAEVTETDLVAGEPVVSGHTDGITMDLCLVPGDYIPVEETLRASFATRPTIAEAWRERRPLEPGEPENAG